MTLSLAGFPARSTAAVRHIGQLSIVPFVGATLAVLSLLMVTAPVPTTEIYVDIPPAAFGPMPRKPPTYLTISDDGQMSVSFAASGTKIPILREATLDSLGSLLAQSIGGTNPRNEEVFLVANPRVRFGVFLAAMNRLHQEGYYHLGLIDERPWP